MKRNKRRKPPPPPWVEVLAPNLPCEIVYHILLRLPAKSLLRFKSVSKSWNALISDPQFILSHHTESQAATCRRKLVYRIGFQRSFWTVYAVDEGKTHVENLHFAGNRNFDVFCSCEGLVLMHESKDNVLFLWNPSVKKYVKFTYPFDFTDSFYKDGYGLCYDDSTNDYKVVVIHENHCFIYSVRNDSWDNSKVFPFQGIRLEGGVVVNGALYWVATRETNWVATRAITGDYSDWPSMRRNGYDPIKTREIMSFNPKDESFCILTRPEPVDECCVFDLVALGSYLGLYHYSYNDREIKIWLRTGDDYTDLSSWKNLMIFSDMPAPPPSVDLYNMRPVCYFQKNEIVFLIAEKLMLYNVKDGTYREMDGAPSYRFMRIGTYMDSLLLPGVGENPKRKWLTTEKRERKDTAGNTLDKKGHPSA